MIAVDSVGAGADETVLILDEGNSARQVLGAPGAPIRTVVVGIVDAIVEPAGDASAGSRTTVGRPVRDRAAPPLPCPFLRRGCDHRQSVAATGADRYYVGEPGRNRSLPRLVSAPGGHCPIGLDREAEIATGSDRDRLKSGGSGRLPVLVAAPARHAAVRLQGQDMREIRRRRS